VNQRLTFFSFSFFVLPSARFESEGGKSTYVFTGCAGRSFGSTTVNLSIPLCDKVVGLTILPGHVLLSRLYSLFGDFLRFPEAEKFGISEVYR
jgi:hypothetical protein